MTKAWTDEAEAGLMGELAAHSDTRTFPCSRCVRDDSGAGAPFLACRRQVQLVKRARPQLAEKDIQRDGRQPRPLDDLDTVQRSRGLRSYPDEAWRW
jgi:hypothetical protein